VRQQQNLTNIQH
jgi:hypothetical protein